MPELGKIYVRIGAKLTDFEKAMTKLASQLKQAEEKFRKVSEAGDTLIKVGKNLSWKLTTPIMALTGALSALSAKAAYTADRIADLSAMTGLSVETIQELRHVAMRAGVNIEAMDKAMRRFIQRMISMDQESSMAKRALEELGVNFEELRKQKPEDMFFVLVEKLADMKDVVQRNAIAAALFGRAWEDIAPILNFGAEGIKNAREEARKFGFVLSKETIGSLVELRYAFDLMKEVAGAAGARLASIVAPAIKSLANVVLKFLPMLDKMVDFWEKIPAPIKTAAGVALAFAAAIGPVLTALGALVKMLASVRVAFAATGATMKKSLVILWLIAEGIVLLVEYWNYVAGALAKVAKWILQYFITPIVKALGWLYKTMGYIMPSAKAYGEAVLSFAENLDTVIQALDEWAEKMFKAKKAGDAVSFDNITKQADEATKSLGELGAVIDQNTQSFDEVHQITQGGGGININVNIQGADDVEELKHNLDGVKDISEELPGDIGEVNRSFDKLDGLARILNGTLGELNDEGFGEFSEQVWIANMMLRRFNEAMEGTSGPTGNAQTAIERVNQVLENLNVNTLPEFGDTWWDTFETTKEAVDTTLPDVTSSVDTATQDILDTVNEMYDEMVGHSIIPDLMQGVVDQFKRWDTEAVPAVQEAINKIDGAVNQAAAGIVGAIDKMDATVRQKLRKQIQEAWKPYKDFLEGIGLSVSDMTTITVGSIERGMSRIKSAVKDALEGNITWADAAEKSWEALRGIVWDFVLDTLAKLATVGLTNIATWAIETIGYLASVAAEWIATAYSALVSFYWFLGPGAPAAAAATIAGAVAAILALAAWLGSQFAKAVGLAEGGIVTAPTLAVLGEGGKKEAVVPLERDNVIAKSVGEAVYNAMKAAQGGQTSGEITVEIDGYELARILLPYLNDEIVRSGVVLGEA